MGKRTARFAAALIILLTARGGTADVIDMVVASVDQEAILYSEILVAIQPELVRIQQEAPSQEAYNDIVETLVEDSLDEAIESKILYREALKFSIQVPDDKVEEQIDQIRKTFDTSEEFIKALTDSGETLSDFRERTRKRIMAQSVEVSKMSSLEKEIVVDEAELVQYYEDHNADYTKPARVRVRQIMIPVRRDAEKRARAHARLEMLREELEAGASFSDLARAYSKGPAAEDGGLIGWASKGDLVPVLEDALFALNQGEVSEVVDSQFGVHLLLAEKKEEAGIASLDEMRPAIEGILRSQAALEKYELWLKDLRQRSRVRVFL
jgi:parvulin-like peptidyl-prolyl isomerase